MPALHQPWGGGLVPPPVAQLDAGIRAAVVVLARAGVETTESCEGGVGHAFPVPTVRFAGEADAGLRAVAIAMAAGLPVDELRRVWYMHDGELTGPQWELTFYETTQEVPEAAT